MWIASKQIYGPDAFVKLFWKYQPLLKFCKKKDAFELLSALPFLTNKKIFQVDILHLHPKLKR